MKCMAKVLLGCAVIFSVSCATVNVPYLFKSYDQGVVKTTTRGNEIITWELGTVEEMSDNIHNGNVVEVVYDSYDKEHDLVVLSVRKYFRENKKSSLDKPYEIKKYQCKIDSNRVFKIENIVFRIEEVTPILVKVTILEEPSEFENRVSFRSYSHLQKRVKLVRQMTVSTTSGINDSSKNSKPADMDLSSPVIPEPYVDPETLIPPMGG